MKKINCILLCLSLIAISISASAQNYVRINRDFKTDENIDLYVGSTLLFIDSIPERPKQIKIISIDKKTIDRKTYPDSGIELNAIFDITNYDEDITKVVFQTKDDKGRYNVSGVTIEFVKILNYRILKDGVRVIIPSNICSIVKLDSNIYAKNIKQSIIDDSYIYKSKLYIKSDYTIRCFSNGMFDNSHPTGVSLNENSIKELSVGENDTRLYCIVKNDNVVVEDFIISLSEFKIATMFDLTPLWIKLPVGILILLIVVACIIYFTIHIMSKKKKKEKNQERKSQPFETSGYATEANDKDKSKNADKIDNDSKGLINSILGHISTLLNDTTAKDQQYIKNHFNNLSGSLMEQFNRLNNRSKDSDSKLDRIIGLLNSSSSDVEKNAEKYRLLSESLKSEKAGLQEKLTNKQSELDELTSKYKDLQRANILLQNSSEIPNTIQVCEYKPFLTFAVSLMELCASTEKSIIKYLNSLSEIDSAKLRSYTTTFMMNKPFEAILKWQRIVACIDLNGYVKDESIRVYLKGISKEQQVAYLQKIFYSDVVKVYVSSILVLIEEIRTAHKMGIQESAPNNIKESIGGIINLCKNNNVEVDYVELFSHIGANDYEKFTVSEDVPESLNFITNIITDKEVILYIEKYAVYMAGKKEPDNKTTVIAKII